MSHGHAVIPKHRQLPDKESRLFKELLTHYEMKQYKKGIKCADQILKKFPNHGETLALKALTLHSSLPFPATVGSAPLAEKAEETARTAVRKDMTSHITWHVLGILAKTRRDWPEASKAFAVARRQDPDNIPVLRDAIALSTHTRNYQTALEARHHYLLLRPQIRTSWLGLVISHELAGDPEEAVRVYDGLQSILKTDGASATEQAQILLHIVRLCIKTGNSEDAFERLEKGIKDGVLSPRGEASEIRAQLLVNLGRQQEAEDAYRALLEQNADNLEFYRAFLRNRGLDISQSLDAASEQKVLRTLETFGETYPRSSAPRRLALDVATGDAFRKLARDYLVRGLERGVPSLFVDVKGVYRDTAKLVAVGEVMDELISELEKNTSLHGDDSIAPPSTLLWAYYFLSLHLVHPLNPKPNYERALELLNKALEHTPTLPEIYMAQAMVLKRAGDTQAAARAMEEARLLDGQDRFLNGKAAKYWLRAGEIKKAEELLALFTKKDIAAVQDLTEMQCLWFLTEEGDAYNRAGNLAMALKRYQSLVTVFQEYEDDQYDFHSYCMRRMTFGAYIALIKYEDTLRANPEFYHSALAAIDIYIRVSDDPSLTVEQLTPEEEAERKRAAKKAAKAEQKARKAAAASGEKKEEGPIPDADARGEKMLQTETPLDDALKLWTKLEKDHSRRPATWLAGYALHVRKGQFALALKDLRAAHAIDPAAPGLVAAVGDFKRRVAAEKDLEPLVVKAIDQTIGSWSDDVEAHLDANTTPEHIIAAARFAPNPATILARLANTSDPKTMRDALLLTSGDDRESLRAQFHKRLPLAFDFATRDEQAARFPVEAAQ